MSTDQAPVRDGHAPPTRPLVALLSALVTVIVVSGFLAGWLTGDVRALQDPVEGLQQLDLLYLDEPAPFLDRLGVRPGEPAVVVVCDDCALPVINAQVVRATDPDVARAFALVTDDGRVGPGYVLIDAEGRLRYRTFDPHPGAHAAEISVLVGGL